MGRKVVPFSNGPLHSVREGEEMVSGEGMRTRRGGRGRARGKEGRREQRSKNGGWIDRWMDGWMNVKGLKGREEGEKEKEKEGTHANHSISSSIHPSIRPLNLLINQLIQFNQCFFPPLLPSIIHLVISIKSSPFVLSSLPLSLPFLPLYSNLISALI